MYIDVQYRKVHEIALSDLIPLYRAVGWSAAEKPELLQKALLGSHSVVTAWDGEHLVGLGNTISDGHLIVYYAHLLVHPKYQKRGIGGRLLKLLMNAYTGFHQQIILADKDAREFYQKVGFQRAGATEPMWIYAGNDHE